MKTLLLTDSADDIRRAAGIIRRGGLVGFPTETVYGLGADALNADAVRRVYAAKGRPSDNPMIVHISDRDELGGLTAEVTADMRKLMDAFWPGPMTMIARRDPKIPDVTTGGLDTVGIRLPSNKVARELIRLSGCPIAAPSANISGKPSPTTAEHVINDLGGRIDAVIVGRDCDIGIESSVIDMTGDVPVILRPGAVTAEMLSVVLDKEVRFDPALKVRPEVIIDPEDAVSYRRERNLCARADTAFLCGDNDAAGCGGEGFRPKSPGMKYRHYAPNAAMTVYDGASDSVREAMREDADRLRAAGKTVTVIELDRSPDGEKRAAHDLFAALRGADENGADVILINALPEEGLGFSVMNRMLKSAGYNIRKV